MTYWTHYEHMHGKDIRKAIGELYTLQPFDNVIKVEDPYTTNAKKIVLDNIVGKTYTSKRELIRKIGIAEKELPKEYSIRS